NRIGVWPHPFHPTIRNVTRPDILVFVGVNGRKTYHFSIHVQGVLKAIGNETDSIWFSVADTNGFGNIHTNDGGWNGLRFEDTPIENDSSIFEYCHLSFGKAVGDSVNCFGGAIRVIRMNKMAIRHSTIYNNYAFYWGGGIYAFKSDLVVEHVKITRNYAGNDGMIYGYGGGLCFVSSAPNIKYSTFTLNNSTGIGGGVSFEFSDPLLLNCVFDDNYSALGGGLGMLRSSSNRMIANLLFVNNESYFFGGGLAIITSSPQLTNLTIANNSSSMGGGLYCNEYADPKIYNSILWGNTTYDTIGSQVWIWDVYSEPGFYNCNIQYGLDTFGGSSFHGIFENCIEAEPQFINPSLSDFHIQSGSCLNNGTVPPTIGLPDFDLDMLPRIANGTVDLGAYEYNGTIGLNEVAFTNRKMRIWPMPIKENSIIEIEAESDGLSQFTLIDRSGRVMDSNRSIHLYQGINSIRLSAIYNGFNRLSQGVYFLEFEFLGQKSVSKIIL
ncbi:MAG: T9SS type A sorting domain-containing protein, partial [Ignavibacteria bacterium]|nr:T9SS type A sorting domain-containing protein [Ignavibacteria bacterium]